MPAGTSTAQTANIIEPPTSTPQTPAPGAATQQPAPEPAVSVPVGPPVAAPRTNNAVRQQQPAGGTGEVTESYVTFGNLRAQGLLDVPDLHLDIHVYSLLSPDRFVFVNMRKYKEKETLEEGPVVSQITPDGVILTHRGLTFLLPRE
jgi:general secretion pathway protein B